LTKLDIEFKILMNEISPSLNNSKQPEKNLIFNVTEEITQELLKSF